MYAIVVLFYYIENSIVLARTHQWLYNIAQTQSHYWIGYSTSTMHFPIADVCVYILGSCQPSNTR